MCEICEKLCEDLEDVFGHRVDPVKLAELIESSPVPSIRKKKKVINWKIQKLEWLNRIVAAILKYTLFPWLIILTLQDFGLVPDTDTIWVLLFIYAFYKLLFIVGHPPKVGTEEWVAQPQNREDPHHDH